MKKTICINCKHIIPNSIEKLLDLSCCKHPKVRYKEDIHNVTGEKCFLQKCPNGRIAQVSSPYPLCEEINYNGDCSYFKQK